VLEPCFLAWEEEINNTSVSYEPLNEAHLLQHMLSSDRFPAHRRFISLSPAGLCREQRKGQRQPCPSCLLVFDIGHLSACFRRTRHHVVLQEFWRRQPRHQKVLSCFGVQTKKVWNKVEEPEAGMSVLYTPRKSFR